MTYTELKIQLMQQGAVFTPAARAVMRRSRFGQITFFDYATTGGVVTVLDERVYVNIPVKFQETPFCIDCSDGVLFLFYQDKPLPVSVRIIPPPAYALNAVRLDDNTPVRELVMTHADRARISPVHGCSCHCNFCTCNTSSYREIPFEQLNQALQIALTDPYNKPRHILISGGTPRSTPESYNWINHIYRYFPQNYSQFDFDVMLSPRGMQPEQTSVEDYDGFLHYLHDECGIKSLSVNLELYNDALRERYIPEKYAIGKENYYQFIRRAVNIFGAGSIRSSLVVGLESMEDTLQGVCTLLDCGCLPVLSAFIPAPGTDTASHPAPSVEFLLDLVTQAVQMASDVDMQLGPRCRPCTHNSITIEAGEL